MKPRIVVFSISTLAGTLREIARDYASQANIELVSEAYEGALTYARNRYYTDTVDVFIAAGSNGAFLQNQLEAPLVVIRTDGFDLMQALAVARRSSSRIGLVTYETAFSELTQFTRAFDLNIPTRTYRTPQDAREVVSDLHQQGVEAVVGPGMVNEIAQQLGLESVLIYSRQGVMRAFDEAVRLAGVRAQGLARPSKAQIAYHTEQDILGQSAASKLLRNNIRLCSSVDFSVLIQGETGVGKELVAQSIHTSSNRAGKPFIAINCASLTETLLESELFGYEDGAFSGAVKGGRAGLFESAQGGTVFLDEIGDMPLAFQTRLLRILEDGAVRRLGATASRRVNFRLLAASHINLQQAVGEGRFRQDLYYRLNEMLIQIPPLRDRVEDIAPLAGYFLRMTPVRVPKSLFDDFLKLSLPTLQTLEWPGNIRQLKNVCKRAAVMMMQGSDLSHWREWFPDLFSDDGSVTLTKGNQQPESSFNLAALVAKYHQAPKQAKPGIARQVLEALGGEIQATATQLGISRSTLWRQLRQ